MEVGSLATEVVGRPKRRALVAGVLRVVADVRVGVVGEDEVELGVLGAVGGP